ncbi:50S ribosomal protein L23 [Candidatus Parcubacteria bacterium]|nr:50S ribosomal protein L23 [Candidatus Parcubacteria bacterium]
MALFARKTKAVSAQDLVSSTPTKSSELASRVLVRPHVTEKATAAGSRRQYIFVVDRRSTKPEIRRAVEDVYGISVVSVQVLNTPGKIRRRGRITGRTPGLRKAVITLAEGQNIDVTAVK